MRWPLQGVALFPSAFYVTVYSELSLHESHGILRRGEQCLPSPTTVLSLDYTIKPPKTSHVKH